MDTKIEMTPEDANIILEIRERFLQKKRESNARYRNKDVVAFNKAQAIYHKQHYYKNKELLKKAYEIVGNTPVVKDIML